MDRELKLRIKVALIGLGILIIAGIIITKTGRSPEKQPDEKPPENIESVSEQELLILGFSDTVQGLKEQEVYTDQGIYTYKGTEIKNYRYELVKVKVKDKRIQSVISKLDKEAALRNVWLTKCTDAGFQVYVEGLYIEFNSNQLAREVSEVIADVTFSGGQVKSLQVKEDKINGKILGIYEDSIEIEGYGVLPMDTQFKVYKTVDEITQVEQKNLIVGYNSTEFVVANGKLCGAFINQPLAMDHIRVLIKTDEFLDIYHGQVNLTADTGYRITYGDSVEEHAAGETAEIKTDSPYWSASRIRIEPVEESGRIELQSVHRSMGTPAYAGSIEIIKDTNGLVIVNDVLLETYLYSVVPSEMPENYGVEALKAQAVCARSYAYNQILKNSYAQYGAHVDDSVKYQVYNNQEMNESAVRAVDETRGIIAEYGGNVIDAYYYSTSCGHTTNSAIWSGAESDAAPYLQGRLVSESSTPLDLTSEENFKNFILNSDYPSYDSKESWYRWNTIIPQKELSNTFNAALASRYAANPNLILKKNGKGVFESKSVADIGTINNITVLKRDQGGVVSELLVEGSDGTVKVMTEYNIRALLAPKKSVITKKDDSTSDGASMLPSAYFIVEAVYEDENLTGFKFTGGGYGHGAGMSQNGAKNMAAVGKSFEDIIKFFYTGVEVKNIYE